MINPFRGFLTKATLKQFFFYHVRWQSGFFVVYPTMQFGIHVINLPFWAALMFSSACGGCIFFFIDRLIFGVSEK